MGICGCRGISHATFFRLGRPGADTSRCPDCNRQCSAARTCLAPVTGRRSGRTYTWPCPRPLHQTWRRKPSRSRTGRHCMPGASKSCRRCGGFGCRARFASGWPTKSPGRSRACNQFRCWCNRPGRARCSCCEKYPLRCYCCNARRTRANDVEGAERVAPSGIG